MDLHYNKTYRFLFVPSYYYLSYPIFYDLKEALKGNGNLYFLNLPEFSENDGINGLSEENIDNIISIPTVDLFILIDYLRYGIIKKLLYSIKYFKAVKIYKNRIWEFLDSFSPDVIITPGETLSTLQCLFWASKNAKPSAIIQPTFISYCNRKTAAYFFRHLKYTLINNFARLLSNTIVSSENVLFGTSFKNSHVLIFSKKLIKYYAFNNHINVSLIPNLNFKKYLRIEIKISLHENLKKKTALLCVHNFLLLPHLMSMNYAEKLNSIYREIIIRNPDIYFLIKIHPRQPSDYEFYSEFFTKTHASNYSIIKDRDIVTLFEESFVHIATSSYTSFEAILCGIPTINILPEALPLNDFLDGEIEYIAINAEDCNVLIENCFSKSFINEFKTRRIKYIENNFCEFDNLETLNLSKIIHAIIKNYE